MVRIGTAGWQLPREVRDRFPQTGSILQRYAARFAMVEINSTFYRPHRAATFARWAADTPSDFRFAVKAPRTVTHEARLVGAESLMKTFLGEVRHLGSKLGPILVQLPPSLRFDGDVAERFLADLRDRFDGEIALEPRHATWFSSEAEALLAGSRIARVAADPAPVPAAAKPGGWSGVEYWRLHGSPRMYWSAYGLERIADLARRVAEPAWVVFDNTGSSAATADALALMAAISSPTAAGPAPSPGP